MTTVLAGLLVFGALILPDQLGSLRPAALVQIPLEGLVVVALLLLLPARAGRVVAVVAGLLLGLLTILKLLDMGFYEALGRAFDPVIDSKLLRDAVNTLGKSIGQAGAIAAAAAVVVVAAAMFVFLTLSMLRLTRLAAGHRATTGRTVAALAVAWLACALLGAQLVPGVPVAAASGAAVAYDSARLAHASLNDPKVFAGQLAHDAFRDTPGDQLLTALRGKDVVVPIIESYGRSAIEDPALASIVDPVLDNGTRDLTAAGFSARSAFVTSPTYGGGSWLAHSTLQSGLWINTEQRYSQLVSSNRLTLAGAFHRANWRTVSVMPGTAGTWPEGAFYHYDQVYAAQNLDYHGPAFTLGTMPDQYTLSAFQRLEYGKPNRDPLFVEMPLTSSHAPWAPVPHMIDWTAVGDGSVYGPMAKEGPQPAYVWRDPGRIKTAYATSIAYSLSALISWVKNYGDDNLVLVFFGDHQPAVVTGEFASRDTPITIVAKDPAVLDRISGWGWQDGLKPGPQAPVWRMDTFRDRFLTAFGPQTQAGRALSVPAR
ncbi:sulfatase [Planosporangium thailandense]|uniref:Sulfatase n=1 Tax=Planosporangium thailandense TaxID=765197 RepID=A0ABX0XX93_9ACTN|nr:sulfatase [Planosporangium thailandense]